MALAVGNTPIIAVTDMSKGQTITFICIYFTNMTTENIFRVICCVKKDGGEKHIRLICEQEVVIHVFYMSTIAVSSDA